MAKTKPKIQNKQTKEKSIANDLDKGPYRSLADMRAGKSKKQFKETLQRRAESSSN